MYQLSITWKGSGELLWSGVCEGHHEFLFGNLHFKLPADIKQTVLDHRDELILQATKVDEPNAPEFEVSDIKVDGDEPSVLGSGGLLPEPPSIDDFLNTFEPPPSDSPPDFGGGGGFDGAGGGSDW